MASFIVMDLDGTLLNEKKEVTEFSKQKILSWEREGHDVIIATGRQYSGAKDLLRKQSLELPIISNNGAQFRTRDGNAVFVDPISHEEMKFLMEVIPEYSLDPVFYEFNHKRSSDMILLEEKKTKELEYYTGWESEPPKICFPEEVLRETIISIAILGEAKEQIRLRNLLHLSGRNLHTYILQGLGKNYNVLEIIGENVNKWAMIQRVASTMNKSYENIIVVGDGENDLEMIRCADIGIMMKNGSSVLQPYADRISRFTNDQDGAVLAIERILS